jgi:hypothetical protein
LQALESSPHAHGQQHIDSDHCSLECEGSFLDDFSDIDSFSDEVNKFFFFFFAELTA